LLDLERPRERYPRATEACCLDQKANRWSEQRLRGIHIASFANEKSEHERFCEKEDCGYSKSEVGKDSRFDTGDGFCRATARKKRMSPAARSQLSAKLKAYWAKKKTNKS
jgi:hypothetical protein